MPVSSAMRRLLGIRQLLEEHGHGLLTVARAELSRLENAIAATARRAQRGRELVGTSARSGNLADRLAGLEETLAAKRWVEALTEKLILARANVNDLEISHLKQRMERRQVETLIEEATAEDAVQAARHRQRTLDDWYRSRAPNRKIQLDKEKR